MGSATVGRCYVAATAALGALTAALIVSCHPFPVTARSAVIVVVFGLFIMVTELRPLQIARGDEEGEVTTSTAFAFALLLVAGPAPALVVLTSASVVADAFARKVWWKTLFNASQYVLSVAAAHLVVHVLWQVPTIDRPGVQLTAQQIAAILLGGAAFILTNLIVTKVGIALVQGSPIVALVRDDLGFQLGSAAVLFSLSPVVVGTTELNLGLLPVLAVPMWAVHRSAAILVERDRQALRDNLTGLANRALYRDRVGQLLSHPGQEGRVAVMLMDLDRFKEINDTLGHHVGDLLLQQLGPRLVDVVPAHGTVARLGGDEFAIAVRVPDKGAALELADELLTAIGRPVVLEGMSIAVEASLGIALSPAHGDDVDTLVQRADVAMYQAKANRRGVAVYESDRDAHSADRVMLVHDLSRAIEDGELSLVFQPQIDVPTSSVIGLEALVRWQHPERGLVMPDQFIALAEQTGVMRALTRAVLDMALAERRLLASSGYDLKVSVNASMRNLQDAEFVEDVRQLLERHDTEAGCLELEITESMIMADPERTMSVLTRLDDMGVHLAIDDFGTGYSSLAYLRRLPVDRVKIDRSFVRTMDDDDADVAIVRSVIDLARNLGLAVTAEGVETSESLAHLRRLGCSSAQGYLISRPLTAPDLTAWLQERRLPTATALLGDPCLARSASQSSPERHLAVARV